MEHQLELVLILLAIAAAVTAAAKKINVPYPIALVLAGAFIGLVPIEGLENVKEFIVEDEVFRFVVISIFLPTLLGEATLKLPFSHVNEARKPILALAVLGTLISYATVGFCAMWLLDLPLETAFVFAALMAATDPVSVLSIFKSLGVNHRLSTVMEGESLANDGVAVVLFKISHLSLAAYIAAGATGLLEGLWEFMLVAVGGIGIGALLAYAFSKLIAFYDDYPLEIVFSMVLFYSAFFLAEHFHVSGVIAVVTAGLIFGNYGARIGMTPTTKLNIRTFWDVLALVANSLVFLMVGLEIARIDLGGKWSMIAAAIAIVLVGRSVAVYASLLPIKDIPYAWRHVFNWGGLKGSLSIALALSLPTSFAGREDVLVLTFGVVLFSLVVQGLTIKPLVTKLGLTSKENAVLAFEESLAQIEQSRAGLRALQRLRDAGIISPFIHEQLAADYESSESSARAELEKLYREAPELSAEQRKKALDTVRYAEIEALEQLAARHVISGQISEARIRSLIDDLQKEDAH